jgi:uncharacterized protein (DUF934 family)
MKFIDPNRDEWRHAEGEVVAPAGGLLLTLPQWLLVRDTWPASLPVGLQLANDEDVAPLRADLWRFALIVLQFPKWTDGRAYSQARLLRSRLRFAGELRAVGEVLVDMLPLLARTGFDAVQLRADQQITSARRALGFFEAHYQGDVVEPRPVFRRSEHADAREASEDVAA